MRIARGVLCFSVAVSGLLAGSVARADDASQAIARGVELRRKHQDADALAAFQQAYALEPTPRALAQIALAEAALERWVSAEADLLRALAAEDAWIARQRDALRLALKEIQGHLATLEIEGRDGAELWMDGSPVTHLPSRPLRVVAKAVVIELRAAGFETARRELNAAPGDTVRERIELEPVHVAPAPAPVRPPPLTPPESTAPAHASTQRALAWAAGGGAVLFAAAGLGATIYEADRTAQYNHSGCGAGQTDGECGRIAGQFRTAQAFEVGGFVLGAASAAASAALFLSLPRDGERDASVRPMLGWVAAGGAALFTAAGLASTIYASDRAAQGDASGLGAAEVTEVTAYAAGAVLALTSTALFLMPRQAVGDQARAWCVPAPAGIVCGYRR
jgi:hypothetical protein